jgi:hypothetical protein
VIERILASALRAPSAGFSQGWAFLALTDPTDRARSWPFVPTRVDECLGACFFGIMPEQLEGFRAEFGIPDAYDPIGAITVGYRADDLPTQSPRVEERRRGSGEVVHRGHWAGTSDECCAAASAPNPSSAPYRRRLCYRVPVGPGVLSRRSSFVQPVQPRTLSSSISRRAGGAVLNASVSISLTSGGSMSVSST